MKKEENMDYQFAGGDRVRLTEALVGLPRGTCGTIIESDEFKASVEFDTGERRTLSYVPPVLQKIETK